VGEDVAQSWLELICRTLPDATHGLIVQDRAGLASAPPLAAWPRAHPAASELVGIARAALAEGKPVVRPSAPRAGSARPWTEVALPFGAPGRTSGAVAVRWEHAPTDAEGARDAHDASNADMAAQDAFDHLRSGLPSLELLLREDRARARLVTALEISAAALEQRRLDAMAANVATELALRLCCDRVSVGILRGGRIRLEALSGSAEFDGRSALARDLEAAMDEACDQDAVVRHPPIAAGMPRVTLAHRTLLEAHGMAVAWTVPLGSQGRTIGALTFERSGPGDADADVIELGEDIAALLGPILDLSRLASQSWLERAREFVWQQVSDLRSPGHPKLKIAVTACLAALVLLTFAKGDYRVTADATLEGKVQRAIVAGVDGYIAEANVRAGALIEEGQVLGRLDDRDLLLEQRSWMGKRAQLIKEHRKALAQHDRSQVNFLSAKIDQANAELDLLAAQLERTRLVAPFDGIVVKGDLSQSLGSPVERGELLFEVAPLDGYRIILEVDQSDIAEPEVGQRGQLALTALPGRTLPLTVERITPVSIAEGGRNFFRVEAQLDAPTPGLRPGMEGVAKIDIDRRRLIWIWTHTLTDWLRLRAWSWLP
jgi:RND family efflux transporter MFP subunit